MLKPRIVASEEERVHELYSLNILDSPLDERFERITRLAKQLFNVPVAAISLIDERRQWFKSVQGLDTFPLTETPRDISFCAYAILQDDIFIIPDTSKDSRFKNNPFVTGEAHVRFYAGFPISSNHHKLGTMCIIDTKPRTFTPEQYSFLKDLGALAETEIQNNTISQSHFKLVLALDQARMASLVDPLTRLWNRQGIYNILKYQMEETRKADATFALAMLDIDHFKKINDNFGHEAGDQALKAIAKCLLNGCRDKDAIGRWGGEEFLLVINESNPQHILDITNRIRKSIESLHISAGQNDNFRITATIGLTLVSQSGSANLEELISKSDQALYQGKKAGRNRVVLI